MLNYNANNEMQLGGQVEAGAPLHLGHKMMTHYVVECFGPDGVLKWVEEFDNIVVNVGLDDILEEYLKGSGYTAAHYIGLTDGTPTVAAGDTMASHAGWVEVQDYDEAVRQDLTLGAVSGQSVDNTASKGVFTVDSDDTTIGGAFVTTDSTKGGSSGILYGAGAFTAGDKTIDDNDVLNVSVTLTAAAA